MLWIKDNKHMILTFIFFICIVISWIKLYSNYGLGSLVIGLIIFVSTCGYVNHSKDWIEKDSENN